MCGIIHCKRTDNLPVNKMVIKRYNKQKSRGTEGFGYVGLKNGVVVEIKRSETEYEILQYLNESICDEILFHHRFPTSTPNFIESTHPIFVSNKKLKYDYYIVHNGVISNDTERRKKHLKLGFEYTTEIIQKWETKGTIYSSVVWNDSEALAIDIALSLENESKIETKGSIAFIGLKIDKKTKKAINLYWGHNYGNPLCEERGNNIFCLSSESGNHIKYNILFSYDYEKNMFSDTYKEIGIYTNLYSSGYNWEKDNDPTESDFDYKIYDDESESEKNRRKWESEFCDMGNNLNNKMNDYYNEDYDEDLDDDFWEHFNQLNKVLNELKEKRDLAERMGDIVSFELWTDRIIETEEEIDRLEESFMKYYEE